MHTACYHGYFDVALWLYDQGHAVDSVDTLQTQPLHWAAATGRSDLVQWLLDMGADPRVKSGMGQTPLDIAKKRGSHRIAAILTASSPL